MIADPHEVARRSQSYLAERFGGGGVEVHSARRVPGGASRATWIVDATIPGSEHATVPDGSEQFVFRMDPEASVLESNRRIEYEMYRSLGGYDLIPVPEVVAIEDDPTTLGTTFFVMRCVEGTASIDALKGADRASERLALAQHAVGILAALHAIAFDDLPVTKLMEPADPTTTALSELDRWEHVVWRDELEPQLVTRAACRWLRNHPPAPASRIVTVHGDYRTGNYLHDGTRITAVLDWELAHLGDPLEDLGWWCSRPWQTGPAGAMEVGSLCDRETFVRMYEGATGSTVDREALRWWELLAIVKLQAIFLTAGHSFATSDTHDVLLAMIPIAMGTKMEQYLLEEMGR